MRAEETIKDLDDKDFLDKLYGYAYKHCSTSHEAEDLCSEIVLAILKSIRQNNGTRNFHAFAWTVAHRVYADFCEKRKADSDAIISDNYSDDVLNIQTDLIGEYIETESEALQLNRIMREIAFLSKIYRDVMVMYYLDEKKTADIAKQLGISETAVKQRLFSARNTIKKEVEKVDTNNLTLKPITISFVGNGNPVGNDPREKAERVFSQNLVYLCKNKAQTAKELSEKLSVPMPFIEDELEIQCHGANGRYGLLRKLDNGKFISNIMILDVPEYEEANAAYGEHLDEFCVSLQNIITDSKDKIKSFPFLSKQTDIRFILWALISQTAWELDGTVREILQKKYLSDIEILNWEFSTVGFVVKQNETLNMGFYGCDGICGSNICGYSSVFMSNIYGERIEKHFGCGHNISTDPQLMMTIRAIEGLSVDLLSEDEKEIAAKAIETGYLRRSGKTLEPKIIVLNSEDEKAFNSILPGFNTETEAIAEKIASKLAILIKRIVPSHLMNEYPMFSMAARIRILHDTIEKCIANGLLYVPDKKPCAEGTILVVKK